MQNYSRQNSRRIVLSEIRKSTVRTLKFAASEPAAAMLLPANPQFSSRASRADCWGR